MKLKYSIDIGLVQAYLSGSLKTEERFYNELKLLIAGVIKRMESTGTLFYNREDIIAEVIYQIMVADDRKVLRNYRGQSRLKTYLWPVIRNKIVDMIRKERTHHNHHLYQEDLEENIIDPPPPSPNLAVEIEECIAQEPPLEQFIKTSKWIEGLSYQEIMDRAGEGIPGGKSLTAQHIAYVLSVNREKFKKKLKKVIT